MKRILISMLIASVAPLYGTVAITFEFGYIRDASGATVADGTLWALVVDGGVSTDGDLTGIDISSGNGGSLSSTANPNTFFSINESLGIGNDIGSGDIIFAMGKVDSSTVGSGDAGDTKVSITGLTLGLNGLTAGRAYALYWFPGVTYTGAGSYSISGHSQQIGSQVGGISSIVDDVGGFYKAMIVPSDGSSVTQGAVSTDYDTGRWTVSDFTAVTLIPEPTSSLLTLFGGLALLFRRRRHA